MTQFKKPFASDQEVTKGLSKTNGANYSKSATKRETVLAWLIDESERGNKVTRFDAEHIGDHCLNTSVSEIERLDGVRISRQTTKRPTRFGKPTDCNEYWISDADLNNARKVLVGKQERRVA